MYRSAGKTGDAGAPPARLQRVSERRAAAAAFPAWPALVLLSMLFGAMPLVANELVVDSQTIGTNDVLTFTVSLEGAFASRDAVDVPLQNLALVGEPWVSSEFAFINGRMSRRKTFRYRARPMGPGLASVGPIVLETRGGERRVLPSVAVQVLSVQVPVSNNPEMILRELEARRRPALFVVAHADKTEAFAGEQIVITWSVYNAATIQQWQVVEVSQMPDFWTEEIETRSNQADTVWVGTRTMQRMTVRRVAAYPLRTGTFQIGGTTIEAAVLEGSRPGPFSIFEGRLVDVTYTSAPITIRVKPLPPGPSVDAVGELTLRCDRPVQQSGGPIVIPVTLSGRGNVRAALPPRFERNIAGGLQIEGGEVTSSRSEGTATTTRRWRYQIFPSEPGLFSVAPLTMTIFDPVAGVRRELRCRDAVVDAFSVGAPPAPPESEPPPGTVLRRPRWPAVSGVLLLGVVIAIGVPRMRREIARRRLANEIMRDATPAEIVARMEAYLPADAPALMTEHSDRGDAWRGLRSLLDAAERDRDIAVGAGREIARRIRDVLRFTPVKRSR
jgi:hypothetical protein